MENTNISLDCGWGKLLFSPTFSSTEKMASELKKERKKSRNVLFDITFPQFLFSHNPQDFFLNPAYVYKFPLENKIPRRGYSKNFFLRIAKSEEDIESLNMIYKSLDMVPLRKNWWIEKSKSIDVFVAEEVGTGKVLGGAMVIDHYMAFNDPNKQCSLWALGVDPQTSYGGLGMALMRHMLFLCKARKRKQMLLSVISSNTAAQKLYEKLGFEKANILSVKNKTPINEEYFSPTKFVQKFSPHIRGIVNEAQKRGIAVEQITADFYRLSFGGQAIRCQESLSELTNTILEKSCRDQKLFFHLLNEGNLQYPKYLFTSRIAKAREFTSQVDSVVIKAPLKHFVSDQVLTFPELKKNFLDVKHLYPEVLVQEFIPGDLYRFLVIDYKIVAIIRAEQPFIVGNGKNTVRQLIQKLSRKKKTLSQGESKIPLDAGTRSMLSQQGVDFKTVLEKGVHIQVRRTANYHKGGTMVDMTEECPKFFQKIAIKAAKTLQISVVELELIIPNQEEEEYSIISANPKPHFTYYGGQPVAERFIDFLFPRTKK